MLDIASVHVFTQEAVDHGVDLVGYLQLVDVSFAGCLSVQTGTVTFLFTDVEGSTRLWALVVRAEGGEVARFTLLETLKAYAEGRLLQTGEASEVRDRHLERFHSLAMSWGRVMSADITLGARLRYDRSNTTAGFDWAATTNQWILGGELLLGSLAA